MKKRHRPADLSATQRRILELLADGQPHSRREIHGRLWDDQASLDAIQYHISVLRDKLEPLGQNIVCELHRATICYRHICLLSACPGR